MPAPHPKPPVKPMPQKWSRP
jgi:hypothetical protein